MASVQFVSTAAVTILLVLSFQESFLKGEDLLGEEPAPVYHILSKNALLEWKKNCQTTKQGYQANYPKTWETEYKNGAGDCLDSDSFTISNLTSYEAREWIVGSAGDTEIVYEVLSGLDLITLKRLMLRAVREGWGVPNEPNEHFGPVVTAIGSEIVNRKGGLKYLTVEDVKFLGPAVVYVVPSHIYKELPLPVFNLILDVIHNVTKKMFEKDISYDLLDEEGKQSFTGWLSWEDWRAASMTLVQYDIPSRIKAVCLRAFSLYGKETHIETSWNRILYLLFCAPPDVCESLTHSQIQSNPAAIGRQKWMCHANIKEDDDSNAPVIHKIFPSNRPCGKIIARKLVEGGDDPFKLNSTLDVFTIGNIMTCMTKEFTLEAADIVGCGVSVEQANRGIYDRDLSLEVLGKCAPLPEDYSSVTCSSVTQTYGHLAPYLPAIFFKSLPKETVLCQKECIDFFKTVKVPVFVYRYVMKECFRDAEVTSGLVSDLGGLILNLPSDKIEEIAAEDLKNNIDQIKKDLVSVEGNRLQLDKIGRKLIESGNIASLVDSVEIMSQVSLENLKRSIEGTSDVLKALGLGDISGSVGFTDSQRKWVIREYLKEHNMSSVTMEDLSDLKSVVTGFLSSDIEQLSVTHSDNGIEIAKIMCQYKNWPVKSLGAVNKKLIYNGLKARNENSPLSALTLVDVESIGCECFMHFSASEFASMDPGVCSMVCQKIGYCDGFRCLNPTHRKNILQGCLKCKGLDNKRMSNTDIDELGPHMIAQMSQTQLGMVPATILKGTIQFLKDMCMNKVLRDATSNTLQKVIGSHGSDYSSNVLYLLGSAIKLLPVSIQEQLDKNVLTELNEGLLLELLPTDDHTCNLKKCCERWLNPEDLSHLQNQEFTLMMTIKTAMLSRNRRKREASFQWTCSQIRTLPMLFLTATAEEITAMDESEFVDCLPDIGKLTDLKEQQKEAVLSKAKTALSKTNVCEMDTSDLISLGAVSLVFTVQDINCLPLNDTGLVSSLGSLDGWSSAELTALASRWLTANEKTDLATMTSAEITMFGSIMCGFTTVEIATIPSEEIGRSGAHIGGLEECSTTLLAELVKLAIQEDAYGPVSTWDAAEVNELKYLIAGLSGAEVQQLTPAAIEGLDAEVIPVIPENVLKEMTTSQIQSFTDAQAVAVTDSQIAVMSTDQKTLLGEQSTGGEEVIEEVVINDSSSDSSGSYIEMSFAGVGLMVLLLLLT